MVAKLFNHLQRAGVVTHPPRKTRFRLLVRLYRTGLVTRRVPSERFQASNYPPFPSFLGARSDRVFSQLKTRSDPVGTWSKNIWILWMISNSRRCPSSAERTV